MADSGVLDEGWAYNAPIGVYLFVRNARESCEEADVVRTRMLIRDIEDPATGSAASALSGFLTLGDREKKGFLRQWKIVQGLEMGRRSEIGVKVELEGGKINTIELSGTAVVVSEGKIRV